MLVAYGSPVGQEDVYPRFWVVKGSGARSKYIVALDFLPEVISCAICPCSAEKLTIAFYWDFSELLFEYALLTSSEN